MIEPIEKSKMKLINIFGNAIFGNAIKVNSKDVTKVFPLSATCKLESFRISFKTFFSPFLDNDDIETRLKKKKKKKFLCNCQNCIFYNVDLERQCFIMSIYKSLGQLFIHKNFSFKKNSSSFSLS